MYTSRPSSWLKSSACRHGMQWMVSFSPPAYSQVDIPPRRWSTATLPPFQPRQVLDPLPGLMGAMVGPEAFTEVRYLAHHKQREGAETDYRTGGRVWRVVGRDSGGLLKSMTAPERRRRCRHHGIGNRNHEKRCFAEMRQEGRPSARDRTLFRHSRLKRCRRR